MDRPALEELRRDVRTPLFDAVYFLDTDRIARDVAYQTIILGELIKHGKRIIIKGKDYVNNPENKFTVREIMLDPGKLRGCIDTGGRLDDQRIARELARIAGEFRALNEERRRIIDRYAAERMTGEAYITANRARTGTSSG